LERVPLDLKSLYLLLHFLKVPPEELRDVTNRKTDRPKLAEFEQILF
jgi:hypothetical protein